MNEWMNECSGFKSSGMWHSVTGWVVSDVSKDCSTFISKRQAVQEEFFSTCLTVGDECITILWKVTHSVTQHHIPECWNSQRHWCENLNCCIYLLMFNVVVVVVVFVIGNCTSCIIVLSQKETVSVWQVCPTLLAFLALINVWATSVFLQ